jgi:hypothetical protein
MTQATKSDPRTALLDFAAAKGWVQDPSAYRKVGGYTKTIAQNPNVLLRSATHGGVWRVHFDFPVQRGYSHTSEGKNLKEITLTYVAPDAEVIEKTFSTDDSGGTFVAKIPVGKMAWTLRRPRKYGMGTSWLYEGTYDENKGDSGNTLAARAKRLLENPDLVVWVAAQAKFEDEVRQAFAHAARQTDKAERARALPVTVDQDGYNSEWNKLARAAKDAAKAVAEADGKSNLPALVAALEAAVANVKAVLA